MRRLTRRQFLGLGLVALPARLTFARFAEPTWLRVTQFDLQPEPTCRFVQFSDLHYKGDAEYATYVCAEDQCARARVVCFTGDLVEDKRSRPRSISSARSSVRCTVARVIGITGAGRIFREYEKAFAATGGVWLEDRGVVLPRQNLELIGMGLRGVHRLEEAKTPRRVLLIHYPIQADRLEGGRYDLIIAAIRALKRDRPPIQ